MSAPFLSDKGWIIHICVKERPTKSSTNSPAPLNPSSVEVMRRRLTEMTMGSMKRRWIPAITFWTLFLVSTGLAERYPWLDTVRYAAAMLFLLGVSFYSLVHVFRHRHETSSISYRAIPRWLERFSPDEKDEDRIAYIPTLALSSRSVRQVNGDLRHNRTRIEGAEPPGSECYWLHENVRSRSRVKAVVPSQQT
jgi:hypothetical protein